MPFDGVMLPAAENRLRLIERLRSPPADRVPWDFRSSRSCALADLKQMGVSAFELGMSRERTYSIFGVERYRKVYGVWGRSEVTAEMVAQKLEEAPFESLEGDGHAV